jgi:hypothetical protein
MVIEIPTDQASSTQEAQITAKLRGMTPLLMHRPGGMTAATGEVKRTNERRIPTPEEEVVQAEYRDDDGILFAPARWIMRAMVEAGKAFQNPQNKRQTMMKVLAAAIIPPPVLGFPLFDPESGEPLRDYEIDVQRVVVQRNAVMRARPRIDDWTVYINLGIDQTVLGGELQETGKFLLDILATAGSKQGFGDFRPEKGGSYGRFRVEEFSISDD